MVLGEMDVARVNSYQSNQDDPPVHRAPGSHSTSSGHHPIPGGDSRSASYPVDDVHQPRNEQGIGDGGEN